MTKRELTEDMAVDAGITKDEAGKALESLLGTIRDAMKSNNTRIALPGFGTFSKVHRKARSGINPATGQRITIRARNAIKFKPSKGLKGDVS